MFLDEWAAREGRGALERVRRVTAGGVSYGTILRASKRIPIGERLARLVSDATGGEVSVFELTAPTEATSAKGRRASA